MADGTNRVLVTGAGGRLGRAVLDLLAEQQIAAVALDRAGLDGVDAERVVVGDAGNPAVVRTALVGVDAVIHLAAIPSPDLATLAEVYGGNTKATFVVLTEAADAGVRRAVLASSFAVTGLVFAPQPVRPAYLPIDEAVPLQVADPYALSKQADEAAAAMAWRRYGMTVTALRLPFVGTGDRLAKRVERYTIDPAAGANQLWSYVDTRDAAAACLLGLAAGPGAHVVFVAAPETLAPYPTEDLLDAYHPGVPRRAPLPGRSVPISLDAAQVVLGFQALHVFSVSTMEFR